MIIGIVLLGGAITSIVRPEWTRTAALITQTFALLGTAIGIFTIVIGIGPRSVPDVVYHIAIVLVLMWGLLLARRMPAHAGEYA